MSMQLSDADNLLEDSQEMQLSSHEDPLKGESMPGNLESSQNISLNRLAIEQLDATGPVNDNAAANSAANLDKEKTGEFQFQKNRNRYVGDVDPVTKLRQGRGVYSYSNPFFQYQGDFESGKKEGEGALLMKDGSKYEGAFVDGEIHGRGVRSYPDGTEFVGDFYKGEKQGYGEIVYGKRNFKEEAYKGDWVLNVRSGYGMLLLRDGVVYKGNFVDNLPAGDCKIIYPEDYYLGRQEYSGQVEKGIPNGIGELKMSNGFAYSGNFKQDKRHGPGKMYIQGASYRLEGEFDEDTPCVYPNEVLTEIVQFAEEEGSTQDAKGKGKKMVQKDSQFTEEEEAQYGQMKIYYEYKTPVEGEVLKEVAFDMSIVYQGPDIEDPNPPEEDEAAKKVKEKAKKGNEKPSELEKPEPKMIAQEPVVMENEHGREFQLEIGKSVRVLKADKT